jgi:hypothetical protein
MTTYAEIILQLVGTLGRIEMLDKIMNAKMLEYQLAQRMEAPKNVQ